MANIKLLCFDLDNTLWPIEPVLHRAEQAVTDWLENQAPDALPYYTPEHLQQWRRALVKANPSYRHHLTNMRTALYEKLFTTAGFPPAEARQQARRLFRVFHDARCQVTPYPGALETLETLARHYPLAALSNGNADLKKIGISDLFRSIESAETVGRAKPAPDIFQKTLANTGVSPQHAVHIGDHPVEDLEAARQMGFHTIWANPEGRPWLDEQPPVPLSFQTFDELPALIEQLNDIS